MGVRLLLAISTIAASALYTGIYMLPGSLEPAAMRRPNTILAQNVDPGLAGAGGSDPAEAGFAPFPLQAQFETGDTWIAAGRRYRLYGLQTCLRGTNVTISKGVVRDCGDLNLIMVQASIRDTRPVCASVAEIDQNNAVVACQTTTGRQRYDLATYIIAQGWGFAADDGKGQLVVPGYRIAEESARSARRGLWAYSDMPHPLSVLAQQVRRQP